MKVTLLDAALAELGAAAEYYAEHANERVAEAFLQDVLHARQRLMEQPEIGTPISKRLRMLTPRHFPYSLIYRFSADSVVIHAVAHQRRRPGYWAKRR